MAWFLRAAHRKMVEEGAKSRELLGKKEPEFEDLEHSQAIHIINNEKACSGENTKGQLFIQSTISAKMLTAWTEGKRDGDRMKKAVRLQAFS